MKFRFRQFGFLMVAAGALLLPAGSQAIMVTGYVAPTTSLVIDQDGDIAEIVSNTAFEAPLQLVNFHHHRLPESAKVRRQYRAMHNQLHFGSPGIIYVRSLNPRQPVGLRQRFWFAVTNL